MKRNLLFFLLLLFFVPTISMSAEMRTIEVEFSFTAPADRAGQLIGFRLYKEGAQVCQTNDSSTATVSCDLLTEDGTFDFSLTALYSDGTQSPHSTSFPFTIISDTQSVPDPEPAPVPLPPKAILSSSTAAGEASLYVTFDGSSSTPADAAIAIVQYNWSFGDGSQATGATTSHTFTKAGNYYTQLTVVDSQGLSDTVSTPIVVSEPTPVNEKPSAVIAASVLSEDDLLTFSFDGSQSSDADGTINVYSWDFGDGTTGSGRAVLHTYAGAGSYTVSLQVTDDRGEISTTSAEIVCENPTVDTIQIEMGEISIDHNWVTVAFEKTFSHPVVIAGPPTFNGAEPVLVRMRNLNETGFEVRLQEWDYQDGRHNVETFSYMVMEEGAYTLDNGTKLEAGHFNGTSSFGQVVLQQPYTVPPVILTQVVTENETDAVTGRINNINQSSFEYKLQEMEATASAHIPETIGYVAWEPGKGKISGLLYEIGTTAKSVTHYWFNLNFETGFPDLPFFIAGMQTSAGSDTAVVRSRNLSTSANQIKIEEEQSKDSEVRHNKEAVGYFSISAGTK